MSSKGPGCAAPFRHVGGLEQGRAGVQGGRFRCWHVGARQDPVRAIVRSGHVAAPSLDLHHLKVVDGCEAGGRKMNRVEVFGELAHGHPVLERNAQLTNAGLETALEDRSAGLAANRVRAVQDNKRGPGSGCRLHGTPHGPDVGVEACPDVLDIEADGVHPGGFEEARIIGNVGAVGVVNRDAGPRVHGGSFAGAVLRGPPETVLGTEDCADIHAFVRHVIHDRAEVRQHAGGVGDDSHLASRENAPVRGGGNIGAVDRRTRLARPGLVGAGSCAGSSARGKRRDDGGSGRQPRCMEQFSSVECHEEAFRAERGA
jgi:hypothetical protein